MKVFVINYSVQNCGVYQYGKRVGDILVKSKNYNFIYLEINSYDQLDKEIQEHNPTIMIFNYLNGTMPWLTESTISSLKEKNIKLFLLVHNQGYSTWFDYYLHQDPYWKDIDDRNFSICRPLPLYEEKVKEKLDNIIRIGSFGFGLTNKQYHQVCKLVNDQFTNENVEINLHLSEGKFCGSTLNIPLVSQMCKQSITRSNIKLNITTNFISNSELLDFLAKNDLNIFLYDNYMTYNGISSVIDYALSVKKPIAINKSNMFSHIINVTPSICIEDNQLSDIINNGFAPLQEKCNSWTHEKFIHTLETILENVK